MMEVYYIESGVLLDLNCTTIGLGALVMLGAIIGFFFCLRRLRHYSGIDTRLLKLQCIRLSGILPFPSLCYQEDKTTICTSTPSYLLYTTVLLLVDAALTITRGVDTGAVVTCSFTFMMATYFIFALLHALFMSSANVFKLTITVNCQKLSFTLYALLVTIMAIGSLVAGGQACYNPYPTTSVLKYSF
ncbi:hypothetical protein BDA99DRAFT_538790 [Phascolomyces articulosus]|uniref:Uncharacterized protein n=1 Tax=Phascolomyces articulosus TaxID=60185 RepID=A0AAD5JXL3_9FUNG|nr:hypothetical protein BDA99DRAFT_538790 [Phascolomyces articulosus]